MAKRITRDDATTRGLQPTDLIGKMVSALQGEFDEEKDKGVVIRAMGGEENTPFEAVPFGIPVLDTYLHGGIPVGRITEVYGPEGSGKSTLCFHAMAAHCRAVAEGHQGLVLYVDSEYGFDAPYAARIGVDMSRVIMVQPEWGQQAFKAIFNFCEDVALSRQGLDPTKPIKNGKVIKGYEPLDGGPFTGHAAVFLDSVASLVPKSAYDRVHEAGDFDAVAVAELARLMSQNLNEITGPIYRAKVAALFTNQTRVGGIGGYSGTFVTTPGGNALKFYASSRWETGLRQTIKEGPVDSPRIVGRYGSLRVVKCRLFSPFAPELKLPYTARGIDMSHVVFETLLTTGILAKKDSWYRFVVPENHPYAGMKFQGTNGFHTMLEAKEIALPELEALARGTAGVTPAVVEAPIIEEVQ